MLGFEHADGKMPAPPDFEACLERAAQRFGAWPTGLLTGLSFHNRWERYASHYKLAHRVDENMPAGVYVLQGPSRAALGLPERSDEV